MNKKGMAIEQVFIFILAAVTFAVILIFGYKSISGFMDKGEEVSFVRFKTDLESSIKKISTEYGAVRIQQFNAPLNYDKICFIDTDYFFDNPDPVQIDTQIAQLCGRSPTNAEKNMPLACDVWGDALKAKQLGIKTGYESVDQNVFLSPVTANSVRIKVSKISIMDHPDGSPRGYICIPLTTGSFTLQLTGKGSHTEITDVKP